MSFPPRSASALRRAARAYVRTCFHDETQPQVNEMAALFDVPPYELSRLFATATGEPLSIFLKRLQVARARRLLRTTELSLNRVGYASGFGTRANFFRVFKRVTGLTPKEFRMDQT